MTNKVQSIVAAAVPEEALMTVCIYVCDEAALNDTRKEQERLLAAELKSTPTFAYLVLDDSPLEDDDLENIAVILAADIDKQSAASAA